MRLKEAKTLESYLQKRIKNDNTRRNFRQAFDSFNKFCKEKYHESVEEIIEDIKQEQDSEYDVLQNWIGWLEDSKLNQSTVRNRFNYLKRYLHYRGIKLYREDVNENLVFSRNIRDEKHALTIDEIRTIIKEASYAKKALYLTLLSSGMRIGETLQLRKKHFEPINDRFVIKISGDLAKTKQGRTVFISNEASSYVRTILNKIGYNDKVFSKNPNPHYAICNEEMNFRRLLEKTGLKQNYEHSRVNIITFHSFRAFFFTRALKVLGGDIAHAMIGHGAYLQQYQRRTDEEKLELYKKCEVDLTVDDHKRIKLEKDELEKEKEIVEKQRIENKNLLNRLEMVQYGQKARNHALCKNLINAQDSGAELLTIMAHLMFETSAPEDEKREIWKKIHESKKGEQRFDLLQYLDKSKPALKNVYSKIAA